MKTVYKEIRHAADGQGDMERIKREVQFLRERRHTNISPLLARVTAGLDRPTGVDAESTTSCVYLLSPQAEMDMQTWFKDEPDYIKTSLTKESHNFNEHIYATMRGLMSGLTYIHRYGPDVGYHGDLKLSNILKIRSSGRLAWNVSDSGTSNLKPVDHTCTQNRKTTSYRATKEVLTTFTQRGDGNHRQSHDVWSLGCIFLRLATILGHKWESEGPRASKDLRVKDAKKEMDHTFCDCKHQIRQRIVELKKREPSEKFGRLLKLIEEMLRPRDTRILLWEVAVHLPTIIDPERPPRDIVDHLKEVVQDARDLKHNPLARARERQRGNTMGYLEVLMYYGWEDNVMTNEQKKITL